MSKLSLRIKYFFNIINIIVIFMATAIVSAFNNIGTQFVAELVETFPKEPQFKVFKSGVRSLIWAKKIHLIQLYAHYCVSFHDQIFNKMKFFLNENYE